MTASTADATDLIRARALIARAHAGESIAGVERLAEGLTNAVYRVAPPAVREALSVRAFTTDCESVSKETAVLSAVKGRLPVPDHLAVHPADATLPFASVSYRWILGLTLNACRRQETAGVLDSLSEPIGQLLAEVAGCPLDIFSAEIRRALPGARSSIDVTLETTIERLRRSVLARDRIGAVLAEALADRLHRAACRLAALDSRTVLVHGDLSGRNLLVGPVDGRWQVVALLDWEQACVGAPLWDIGSMFRYGHRYSEQFRDGFVRGYLRAGGTLPDDWYDAGRLLDATRLVGILDGAGDLPDVHRECCQLLEVLVSPCRKLNS